MNSGIVFECLRELQFLQTREIFSIASVPPLQIGSLWSTVNCLTTPQYAHSPTGLTIFRLKALYLFLLSGFFFIHFICRLTHERLFFAAHSSIAILYRFLFFKYRSLFFLKTFNLFFLKYSAPSIERHFLQRLFLPSAPFLFIPKSLTDNFFWQLVQVLTMAQHNMVTYRSQ